MNTVESTDFFFFLTRLESIKETVRVCTIYHMKVEGISDMATKYSSPTYPTCTVDVCLFK